MNTPQFKQYIQQVKVNARVLSEELMKKGHKLVTNGTENHLLLLNVRDLGLTGSKFEKMCDEIHITLNKNTILGDQSAVTPGGVRIGTPAVTTRGYVEADMKQVANFLDEAAKLSIDIQKSCGSKKLQDFLTAIPKDARVKQLGNNVQDFSMQFDIPGFDASKIEKF